MALNKKIKNLSQDLEYLPEISEDAITADIQEVFQETLENIQESSEELAQNIEEYLKTPKNTEDTIRFKDKPDQYVIDLVIPYCTKCKEPKSIDLYGNNQCFFNLKAGCPILGN